MCALQFAGQTEQKSLDNNSEVELAEDKLRSLNELLQKHLTT
jgi:cell division protein ZapA